MLSQRETREQEQEFSRPNQNNPSPKCSIPKYPTLDFKRLQSSPRSCDKKKLIQDEKNASREIRKNSLALKKNSDKQDAESSGVFRVLNFANVSIDESTGKKIKASNKISSGKKSDCSKENKVSAKEKGKEPVLKENKNKGASSKKQDVEKKNSSSSTQQKKNKVDLQSSLNQEAIKKKIRETNHTSISLNQADSTNIATPINTLDSSLKSNSNARNYEAIGNGNKMTNRSTKKLTIDLVGKNVSKKNINQNNILASSVTNGSDNSFSLLKAETSKSEVSYLEKIFQSPAGENHNLNSSQNSLNTKSFFQEIKECKERGGNQLLKNKIKEKVESKRRDTGDGLKIPIILSEFQTPKKHDPSTVNLDLSQDLSSVKKRNLLTKEERPPSSSHSMQKSQPLGSSKPLDSNTKSASNQTSQGPELTKEQMREKLIKKTILSFQIKKRPPTTTLDFYKIHKILGKGAFGSVYLGEEILTEKLVAIKAIEKTFLKNEIAKKRLMQEVMIMKKMNHKNVIKLLEVFESKRFIFIVMEYSKGKNLHKLIKDKGLYSEEQTKIIVSQLLSGLSYVHDQNILHRDIKLDNLLLNEESLELKICDFGISRPVINNKKMTEQSGTPAFMAPEIIKGKGYEGYGSDLWALGVVVFTLLNGFLPYKGNNPDELINSIMKNDPTFAESVSKEGKDFVRRLLMSNPKKRAPLSALLKHKWLTGKDPCETGKQEIVISVTNVNKKTGYLQMFGEKREEKLPIDENVFKKLEKLGFPPEYLEKCLSESQYTHANACYQLLLCPAK